MNDSNSITPEERKLAARLQRGPIADRECPSASDLSAYVDGAADAGEIERIEGHLADCPRCLKTMIETRELLGAPAMAAPKGVIERAKALRYLTPRRWPAVARWTAAVAASILIGLAGLLAGSSLYQSRLQTEEKLTSAITFELMDAGREGLGNHVFEALVEQDKEVRQ